MFMFASGGGGGGGDGGVGGDLGRAVREYLGGVILLGDVILLGGVILLLDLERELEELEPCKADEGMTDEEPDLLPLVGGVSRGCLVLGSVSPPIPCPYLGAILDGRSRSLSLRLLFDLSLDLCRWLLPCRCQL